MPLWVPIIIGGVLFLGGGVTTVYNWGAISKKLKGKKIAVIGEPITGKSTFINFLLKGTLIEEYRPTGILEKHRRRKIKHRHLKYLKLKIDDIEDLRGGTQSYPHWKKWVENADYVFYLLRVDRIFAGNEKTIENTTRDIKHISDWIDKIEEKQRDFFRDIKKISNWTSGFPTKQKPDFFIIGTFCDKEDNYVKAGNDKIKLIEHHEKFLELPAMKNAVNICGGYSNVMIFLGSMKNEALTKRLFNDLFCYIGKKYEDEKPN